MSTTATHPTTALADVHARPLSGPIIQALALLMTAAPVIAVGLWALAVVL